METRDLAKMSPQDGVVALRSLPRRFRAALRPFDEPDFDEWAERLSSTGHSPLDHLVDADRTLTLLRQCLEQVLHHDTPALSPATLDPAARDWPAVHSGLQGELDHLAGTAEGFAAVADRVPAADWGRTATVAGRLEEITALDILREAVRTAVTDLRTAQIALDEVRR